MTQASFTISGSEFTPDFIERLRVFLNGSLQQFEFVIRVKEKASPEKMRQEIEEAIEEVESASTLVEFSAEEYQTLVEKLKRA